MCIVRASGRVQVPDCGAPARPSDFAAGLIRLSLGRIAPGGSLPVNTNGGGLSFCHPGAYGVFTVVEAVEQLRGQAGERQIKGATTALCHGNGAVLSAQSTAILGTAATL